MHVLWLTARSMADLCSTTQRNLINGLLKQGHRVTFVNGDETISLKHGSFTHVSLPTNARRGFRAKALGKAMRAWLSLQLDRDSAVAVVEWRVVHQVVPVLERMNIAWTLMDRSPPADPGLFGRLQWRPWRLAWKKAKQAKTQGLSGRCGFGTVQTRRKAHPLHDGLPRTAGSTPRHPGLRDAGAKSAA